MSNKTIEVAFRIVLLVGCGYLLAYGLTGIHSLSRGLALALAIACYKTVDERYGGGE